MILTVTMAKWTLVPCLGNDDVQLLILHCNGWPHHGKIGYVRIPNEYVHFVPELVIVSLLLS